MQGVILDSASFDNGDIDLSQLTDNGARWTVYRHTDSKQTAKRIHNQDVVVTNKVALTHELILGADALKLILIAATGTDNVDLDACKEKNIRACNVVNYATATVTQHALTMMLNLLTHQIDYQLDVKQGRWSESKTFCLLNHPIIESEGKTIGIIGYGELGKKMTQLTTALGMKTLISERPGGDKQPGRTPFEEVLETADVISIHCPLTAHTKHLFGDQQFKRMKRSAIIINTARGAIIDPHALATALKNGDIAGAAIDVLDQEPPVRDHPLLQPDIPNLIVTPHNAWGSQESRQRLVDTLAQNLYAWLANKPINLVA